MAPRLLSAAGISTSGARSGYDWNKDGWINFDDACAYKDALISAGALTANDLGDWWGLMNSYGWDCP